MFLTSFRRVYKQDDESVTLGQIAALISSLPPSTLRREQTMWLLQHDESAAVEVRVKRSAS